MTIREFYTNLKSKEQIPFRNALIDYLKINIGTFYMWLTRDVVPERYKTQFENFISNYKVS